jgi:hypothetical protein
VPSIIGIYFFKMSINVVCWYAKKAKRFISHSIEEINEKKSKAGSKEHTKETFQI